MLTLNLNPSWAYEDGTVMTYPTRLRFQIQFIPQSLFLSRGEESIPVEFRR